MGEIFEKILDAYVRFIEGFWSFGLGVFSIPIVFAVIAIIAFFIDKTKIDGSNSNTEVYNYYGWIYKSVSTVRLVNIVNALYGLYMTLWIVYMVVAPHSEFAISNLFWIVVMSAAAILLIIGIFYKYSWRDTSYIDLKIFLPAAGAILFCKMFSKLYFEECDSLSWSWIIICAFSWLAAKAKQYTANRREYTIDYFNDKNKCETYISVKPESELIERIANKLPLADAFNSEKDFQDTALLQNIFGSFKTTKYLDNEEYLKNIEEANKIDKFSTDRDYLSPHKVIENSKNEYSVHSYTTEAIEKVFNAMGYKCEATPENYVKFRKTAGILKCIYEDKFSQQYDEYCKEIDGQYDIIANGVNGERVVFDALSRMKERYPDMKILPNFRFNYGDGASAECDMLIITTGGIFCIEVKNYGQDANYILEISANGTWYKRYGEQLHQLDTDPFRQNSMHAEALVQRFGKELSKLTEDGSVPEIYELVVVPNDIQINNNSLNRVLHIGGLCEFIATEAKKFDKKTVSEVAESISACALPAPKFERVDFLAWARALSDTKYMENGCRRLCEEMRLSEKYRII